MVRVLIYFLTIAGMASCNKVEGKGEKPESPPVPVETQVISLEDADVVVRATGTVEARSDVTVVAEAPGKIEKVLFEMGDEVEEGQILIKLDRKLQRLAVRQASAQLEQAKAASELAELQKQRMDQLLAQGSASKAEIDKVSMEAKSASAMLTMAKVALEQAQHALGTTTVTSPIPGKVTLKLATRGQMLAPGSPVAQVTDLSTLKVTVGLTEKEVADLVEGQSVEVTSAVNEEIVVTGRIAAIGMKAVGPTRAFPVEVWIDDPDPRLHPGMTVDLRITVARLEGVVMVHVNDVFEESRVWVVEDGVALRRDVVPGRRVDEKVVIESGLAPGDLVVTKGGEMLREGARVSQPPGG